MDNLTGEQNPLVIGVSTLAIAALFNPLRLRVQRFVDRRFLRQKYDAEQAMALLSAMARDEVELKRLVEARLSVVSETMQPEGVFLILTANSHDGTSAQPGPARFDTLSAPPVVTAL